jgi:LysM repeat protein
MDVRRSVAIGTLLATVVGMLLAVGPALGAPLAQDNLLTNPDFEGAFPAWNGDPNLLIPEGWEPWYVDNPQDCYGHRPSFGPTQDPLRLKSGMWAVNYFANYRVFTAGLLQRVKVTAGKSYRFQASGYMLSTDDPNGNTSSNAGYPEMKVGIDPTGGSDPFSSNVVWSAISNTVDEYVKLKVTAKAAGETITVFLYASPNFCLAKNYAYWDNASLTEDTEGGGGETGSTGGDSGGGAEVPVGSIKTATPEADGSIVHVVQPGETLIGLAVAYQAYGVTVDTIRELNNLTSDMLIIGQRVIIRGPTSGALPEVEETPEAEGSPEAVGSPEAEESPEAAEAPEVATGNGQVCVLLFDDANQNGIRDLEEQKLAGIPVQITSQGQVIASYTTDGVSEPYCFADLSPESYEVSWESLAYTPTNEQAWTAEVTAGATLTHEFGAQLTGATGEEEAGQAAEEGEAGGGGLPPIVTALGAAAGVMLLLAGMGAAVYFFLLRRAV